MGLFSWLKSEVIRPTITITNRTEEERIRKEQERIKKEKICNKIKELFNLETVMGGITYSSDVYAKSIIYGKEFVFGPVIGERYVEIQGWHYPSPMVKVFGQTKEVSEEFVRWLAELEGWQSVELDMAPEDKFNKEDYIAYPENKSV